MTLKQETIDRLQENVEYGEVNGYDMNARDWGGQEGCLISFNEAKAILASVKGEEWVRVEELYPFIESPDGLSKDQEYMIDNANQMIRRERKAYIKGRQTTSQEGLRELVEWIMNEPVFHAEAKILIEEILTKANEILNR